MSDIKVTDWIAALAALAGVVFSFITVLKLIRKDKDKQAQIDKLTSIAAVLENQNEIMVKHNELIAQQVDILRNTMVLRENDEGAVQKLQAIEEQKLRLSVLPRLWLNGAGYNGSNGELKIDLNNKGEVAHLDEFNLISGALMMHSPSLPYDLEKGERRYIFARTDGSIHIKDTEYEIEVLYHNALGQHYRAIIQGKGANAKIVSDNPVD